LGWGLAAGTGKKKKCRDKAFLQKNDIQKLIASSYKNLKIIFFQ
jgi:hypothetical protein